MKLYQYINSFFIYLLFCLIYCDWPCKASWKLSGRHVNFSLSVSCSARPQQLWNVTNTACCSDANRHSWHENVAICPWKPFRFPRVACFPLWARTNSNILVSLSLHHLPLLSPPISSRANSKLICNSQWQRNWCLILALGNGIMWEIRNWKIKRRGRAEKNILKWGFVFFILIIFPHWKQESII